MPEPLRITYYIEPRGGLANDTLAEELDLTIAQQKETTEGLRDLFETDRLDRVLRYQESGLKANYFRQVNDGVIKPWVPSLDDPAVEDPKPKMKPRKKPKAAPH